jgi:hypothetical protein
VPPPYELMAVPFEIWLAAEGTAKPDITDNTLSGWTKLGARGADEYDEAGITVTHEQEVNVYRGLRGTGPIKAWRTSEGLKLGFTLNDLTLESYGRVLNNLTVEDVGSRALTMRQGDQVATFALLARAADGPYGDDLPVQYWIPKVFQSASPAVNHRKGIPAGLALEFTALEWLDAATEALRFGVLEAQDASGS